MRSSREKARGGLGWLCWSCVVLAGACASDPAETEPEAVRSDAGHHAAGRGSEHADAGTSQRDGGAAAACDLSGTWVTQHNTTNSALGAPQLATNWNYHRIEQDGSRVRIVDSLDCGYVVRGSTDVALSDATLEAMARFTTNAVGVEGTFEPTKDGKGCTLHMDRIYTIRGANKKKFLDASWKIGDADKPLSEFSLPSNADEGMEDWDEDEHEGITQLTGLGDRYTAQLDWHAFSGTLTAGAIEGAEPVGGEGVISVDYDARESVSEQTSILLRTSSVPMPPGYGFLVRADDLDIVTSGDHPELATCKNVQALAVEKLGDPPRP
jgi:hypothetical protein